jgi:aromatic ring-opening dioxygenase catalytic subunit (LigB family)
MAIGAAAGGVATIAGLTDPLTSSAKLSDRSSAKGRGGDRMPVVFVPHGGGPWPFVDMGGMLSKRDDESLRSYLVGLPEQLPSRPKALLVISAHWEAPVATVMTSKAPPMFYDYGGFPPEAYQIQWSAPGDPTLAARVQELLRDAGIPVSADDRRGFDHGTFIPFKLSWPAADIPTVQLSLKSSYDPAEHIAMGRALAPLRDEGVLILGSGMSFHSFRSWRTGTSLKDSVAFDAWLQKAATAEPELRTKLLLDWESAPGARLAHPEEDHLLPLFVVAGAAGADIGRITYSDEFFRSRLSAFHFGKLRNDSPRPSEAERS